MDAFDWVMVTLIGAASLAAAGMTIARLPDVPIAEVVRKNVEPSMLTPALPEGVQSNGVFCPNKLVCKR